MDLQSGVPGRDATDQAADDQLESNDGANAAPTYSFERFCVSHYGELMNFAQRLCGNKAIAEDVVHDTFEKAMRAWKRFVPDNPDDVGHSARAWLYRIVTNTYIKVFHRRRVQIEAVLNKPDEIVQMLHGGCECTDRLLVRTEKTDEVFADWDLRGRSRASAQPIVSVSPFDMARSLGMDSPFSDEVLRAIQQLRAEERSAVVLYYVADLDCAEIARRMEVAVDTVHTRLFRARATLERLLGSYPAKEYNLRRRDVEEDASAEVAE